jgi:hypothetical protein
LYKFFSGKCEDFVKIGWFTILPVSLTPNWRHKVQRRLNMKKTIVLLLVLVLTFAVVIPASAGGNGPAGGNGNGYVAGNGKGSGSGSGSGSGQQSPRGTFAITGTITAIGTNNVTVTVIRGNKLVQPYIGTSVTVTVTPQTRYLYHTDTATTIIKFLDLKLGQSVSVNGTVADNIWTASRITVGAKLSCLP